MEHTSLPTNHISSFICLTTFYIGIQSYRSHHGICTHMCAYTVSSSMLSPPFPSPVFANLLEAKKKRAHVLLWLTGHSFYFKPNIPSPQLWSDAKNKRILDKMHFASFHPDLSLCCPGPSTLNDVWGKTAQRPDIARLGVEANKTQVHIHLYMLCSLNNSQISCNFF